jgi:hypothetical protein
MGHTIDVLFSTDGYELGCVETGTVQKDANTDKSLDDSMLKLPKQLKDILCVMLAARPDLIRSIKTVDLVIITNSSNNPLEEEVNLITNISPDILPTTSFTKQEKQVV